MSEDEEMSPKQEWRVISDWLAFAMMSGIQIVSRRYVQLIEAERYDEAEDFLAKVLPSLWRRSIAFEDHYLNDTTKSSKATGAKA